MGTAAGKDFNSFYINRLKRFPETFITAQMPLIGPGETANILLFKATPAQQIPNKKFSIV